jgi:hypothetical protein
VVNAVAKRPIECVGGGPLDGDFVPSVAGSVGIATRYDPELLHVYTRTDQYDLPYFEYRGIVVKGFQ